MIKSTKIGKVVSRLADGSKLLIGTSPKDLDVQKQLIKEAKRLKLKWTEVIERRVELKEEGSKLEVKLDAISASFRTKASNLMIEAVNSYCDSKVDKKNNIECKSDKLTEDTKTKILMIIELVEKYIFISNNKRTNNFYRKTVRKLTFDLKSNRNCVTKQLIEKKLDETNYKSVAKIIENHIRNISSC